MDIKTVCVVGGGTAGFMTATHLMKQFNNLKVIVIESPDFPTVGVGESTLQHMRIWNYANCIEDEEWMPHCDASYKVSIKFTNWDGLGSQFHYPFGHPVIESPDDPTFIHIKNRESEGQPGEFAEFLFPSVIMAEQKKLVAEMPGFHYKKDSAYHFDAAKFGQWLKNNRVLCKDPEAVINETVDKVVWDEDRIVGLVLTSGRVIEADLFVDCTGWKSMLTKDNFNDYSDYLPNNKAWATQLPGTPDSLVTNCTTLGNGWVWDIPTASRTGTGYVYSDKYISDEDALEEFKDYLGRDDLEFKNIKMRIGRHDTLCRGNVASIGLSYGFIEPLESNGLLTVIHNLYLLEKAIRSKWTYGALHAVNEVAAKEFDGFACFVYNHYSYAGRDDTKYWREVGKKKWFPTPDPHTLVTEQVAKEYMDMTFSTGMCCIQSGLGFNPTSRFEQITHSLFMDLDLLEKANERVSYMLRRKADWLEMVEQGEEISRAP